MSYEHVEANLTIETFPTESPEFLDCKSDLGPSKSLNQSQ